ncbi:hypothetical protein XACW160_90132 [Xanthomonas citri pv. citri]|nr:hypothetical protein XAC3824_120133 [Xanthomonas citri pv. citri]CEE16662.1 hypothetical protein XAC9322_110029 [Xanthomonas citri pv. citri]CEE17547.1 hypothetical protein XAC1083_110133 [Xanthomonas citri pv. citri]CEE51264.1 hypothetical protein XAC71A_130132 [Xanthomonas citri pv. citri]CEE54392.1 hypothetical protein XACS584_130030 [Xanthomonas citri pv. citri]
MARVSGRGTWTSMDVTRSAQGARRLAMVGGRRIALRNGGVALCMIGESRHDAIACPSAVASARSERS